MKAFKGCVNEKCSEYRKKHYKNDDKYCLECGHKLYYVCADCWKQFDDNKDRYCISCDAARKDKREKRVAAVKDGGQKVLGVVAAVAGTVGAIAANTKQIEKGVKVIADTGAKVAKFVAKK